MTDNTASTSVIAVGSAMFVTGSGFGDTQGSSTLQLNGTTVPAYFWSGTSVHAFIPSDTPAGAVAVQIITASGASNTFSITVTGQPAISAISPTTGPAGTPVTITGINFGATAVPNISGVTFRSGPALSAISWSDTQIVVAVPAGMLPSSGSFFVFNNGLGAGSPSFLITPSPHISSISPSSAVVGAPITINGSGFVSAQNLNLIFIGGVSASVVSWSDTQIVANVPAGAQTGTIYVSVADATLNSVNSNQVAFSLQPSSPLLQLSITDAPLQANLTSPQVLDWIHWGRISATIPDRKDGITPLISDYTAFNGAQPSASSGNIAFSWTDGNHPAVVSEANEDVETFNTGSGFQITVPADTTVKTLNLYAEVFFGQAMLQATLSDGSAAAISDQSVTDPDTGSKIYSIDFRAASAGQTLTVTFSATAASSGGVGLQAATLTSHLPTVSIVSPTPGQMFPVSGTVPVNVTASQFDSSITDIKVLASDGTVLDATASPLASNWQPAASGHYTITASAQDSAGLSTSLQPLEVNVIGQGGSLAVQRGNISSPVDLSVAGVADWILWGPVNTGDSVPNNPGNILARKTGVAGLITDYKPIGNHFINSVTAANGISFSDVTQNFFSAGSQLQVFGRTDGYEITVPADTTTRMLQVYAGTVSARGKLTAFLSDGSAPVVTDVGFDDPNGPDFSGFGVTSAYSITYSAASAGQTLTVRYTMDFDYGNGQISLMGAALNGSPVAPVAPNPQITSISPGTAPTNTKVTIAGSNFGATQAQGGVYFGGVTAQIVNWSDTSIGVIVPAALQTGSTVQVVVINGNGASNLVNFNVPIYKISPQNIAMIAGQSRTVSVTDASGNTVSGLGWITDDLTIVNLSTDDPPVITALAPGVAKVWAGDVSFPITVYAADSIPPGTPLWSLPISSGSTITDLIPAVPSDSGADVFALDDGGTLTAVSSDGKPMWRFRVFQVHHRQRLSPISPAMLC